MGSYVTGVPFDVVGGVTWSGLRIDPDPIGSRVDGERQTMPFTGFVDRPVLALAEGGARARIDHHLNDLLVIADPVDLPRRCDRILLGNID